MCPQVHSLSVRAKGKLLLENTQLTVTAGRRYGLVGPNGKGKSTLLRLIARRQIPVPEALDVLLVEQVCYFHFSHPRPCFDPVWPYTMSVRYVSLLLKAVNVRRLCLHVQGSAAPTHCMSQIVQHLFVMVCHCHASLVHVVR